MNPGLLKDMLHMFHCDGVNIV